MSKKVRTIAFQVDDWDFLKEYDRRQQESGVSVKNYFIGLIKADIALHQEQSDAPLQEEPDSTAQPVISEPEQNTDISTRQAEEIPEPDQDAEELSNTAVNNTDGVTENEEEIYSPVSQQDKPGAPEEMMNLFVKITREQRDTLEAHKNATGETVGKVLNRLIDDFLDHTDSLPEGFEEAFQRYSQNTKLCDTTASGKIPAGTNQELTNYLDSFGGSRNALMATLVELELKEQELAEMQDEDQGISMA